jgi:hypothetical protein
VKGLGKNAALDGVENLALLQPDLLFDRTKAQAATGPRRKLGLRFHIPLRKCAALSRRGSG